jgi:uncharacterized protein (TIGR03437 family)
MNALLWLALSTIAFEPNQGQADRQARFLARGPGYDLVLNSGEAAMARGAGVLRWRFVGARERAPAELLEPLSSYSQYYLGDFRARVPRYGRLRFREVYPGVDVVYYGRGGELEYDLVVAPGADPGRIRLAFDGVQDVRLSPEGDLVLATAGGEIRQRRPVVEQDGRRIPASYALFGGRQVGFRLGRYDRSRPLVVDPILRFASYLGGAGDDAAAGVALDTTGNIYIVGNTTSTNFPRFPANQPGPRGGREIFVMKLNPAGAGVSFSIYLGGGADDSAAGVAVDAAGNILVAGTTSSQNFPGPGGGLRGPTDGFVARLDPTGGLLSTVYIGGSGEDSVNAVAVDAAGNAYVTGATNSSDFPTSSGALRTFPAGGGDAFVVKIAPGSGVAYSTFLGGILADQGLAIAVDGAGNAYVTGATFSTNFPTVNPHQAVCFPSPTPFSSCADAFVAKINPAGTALVYSTYLGGGGNDAGRAIAVDSVGNAHVSGVTNSINFPVHAPLQGANSGGAQDLFVTRFNANGGLIYSTYVGGSGDDAPAGVAIDRGGNTWIAGSTTSTNFPVAEALRGSCPAPCADAFLTQVNAAGTGLVFSTFLGGSAAERGLGLALDAVGAAYVVGETFSPNFPVTQGAVQIIPAGRTDAFLIRIGDPNPAPVLASLEPISIAAGNFGFTLTVNGTNFVPGATVLWNGDQRPTTFVSSVRLQAEISGGDIATPASVQIAVVNPPPGGGTSNSLPFLVGSATAPTIAAISPGSASVGDPDIMLTLTGSNFLPTSVVRWNGSGRPTTFVSASQITVTIPAADLSAAGIAQITVFNPPPGGGASNSFAFTVVNPAPVLTGLAPASAPAGGPDFTLTVTGSRFLPTSVVRWNGSNRSTSFVGPAQLRALISAADLGAAGAAQVTVFNPAPGGGSSGVLTFTIAPAPILSPGGVVNAASFSTQPLAAGSIAAIFGSNLGSATAQASSVPLPASLAGVSVQVDGIAAPLFFVSPLQINFVVPWEVEGRTQVSLTVTSGGNTSAPQTVLLAPRAPALFSTNQRGTGQGAILIAGTGVIPAPGGTFPGSRPIRRGEYLEIYGIGLGPVNNAPPTGAAATANPLSATTANPTVTVGGAEAPLLFSGLAAGFVGLYQINVQVPENAPVGAAVQVVLSIGGASSNTVTIAVE